MNFFFIAYVNSTVQICSPEHYDNTRSILQTCISDIKKCMTENKLQLNTDKTEAMLFNASKLKHPPAPLSICQATISFSDSVRSLGFYLDKNLSMKECTNFICKTAVLEIQHIGTICPPTTPYWVTPDLGEAAYVQTEI